MKNGVNNKYMHRLYGKRSPRIYYKNSDFIDYVFMNMILLLILYISYAKDFKNIMFLLGAVICVVMPVTFVLRHGMKFSVPLIVRKPMDAIYLIVYRVLNIKPVFLIAVSLLVIENLFVHLTPWLPHHADFMQKMAFTLFYIHFSGILVYRTVILVRHLQRKTHVVEFLSNSPYKSQLAKHGNGALEIYHGYLTGVLAHITFLAPWYLVISYSKFSLLVLPFAFLINKLLISKFLKVVNDWYYRDHWLGHNSELDFLYLHGSHHDALPSGLIGVSGTGFIEGYFRNSIGFITAFLNPVVSFIFISKVVYDDIVMHQYIPGVYPRIDIEVEKITQHSTHHFGKLEPYGIAINSRIEGVSEGVTKKIRNFPDELKNSIDIDSELNGFKWENSLHKWYIKILGEHRWNSDLDQ